MLTSSEVADLKLRHARARQAGQATIEYILVLVVVLAILSGVLLQFNRSFKTFTVDLLGNYVICLLENGELPGIGSESGQIDCARPQFSFSPEDVAANAGGGNAGSSQNGGAGGSGADGQGGQGKGGAGRGGGKSASAPKGSKATDGGGGGGINFGGANFASGGATRPRSTRLGSSSEDGGTGSAMSKMEIAKNNRGAGGLTSGYGNQKGGRVIASYSLFDNGKNPDADRAGKIPLGAKDEAGLKPKRTRFEPQVKKAKTAADQEDEFSLGALLRYILIAAILIVLVVFIGGQAMQAVKSVEKG